jgi:phosphonate transport system substrate-binding protein
MRWAKSVTVVVLALLVGCNEAEPVSRPAEKKPTLLIGLIPERNIFKQFERYEPLAAYLSEQTGVDVKLKVLAHYGNVVENFESLKLDGAFFGSVGYSLAHARLGVEVLARPESLDGTSTYRGVIVVRKDSGIATVRQMKRKRLALVAQGTFAGYLFPTVYLHGAGIRDAGRHFEEVYFAGSHEGAIRDVLDGKADVGATKNTVLKELAASNPRVHRELTILAESADAPENGLAVRSTISPSVKKKLLDALTAMHEDPRGAQVLKAFGAVRFIRTTEEDYEPVRAYARDLGLDFATCCFESAR